MKQTEYLSDFGPNSNTNGLREAAMARVGELDASERVYFNGPKPGITGEELTRAMAEICASTPIFPAAVADRGEHPMFDGLLAYFPAALAWVARCSWVGNKQHNPGQPMHWALDKSTDHENKIVRHLMESGTDDSDGIPHSVKVAWRALALAQEDLMKRKGYGMPRNARRAPTNPVKQSDEE